ncbi:prephenate dehydrogenase [Luteolibacter sp. Populi]|uniref:prephenate dehydrogenase n=1 Tax=Luteolibacter sp. Populi TaxID=3230487 RepID=UPI003465B01C
MDFQKVAILGGGLLGGSLALALQERFPNLGVNLWSRRLENVKAAKIRGIAGATDGMATAINKADLVVLATPVGAMASVLLSAQGAGLSRNALITDVGSVKAPVHRVLRPLLKFTGGKFIGSHPMAGSEKTGVEAARKDLFQDAACLITDEDQVGEPWVGRLRSFWEALGCKVYEPPDGLQHDIAVANVSHFPHMMAAATSRSALREQWYGRVSGGGLRDTTRVASGDPNMWAEIAVENKDALAEVIRSCILDLGVMLANLEAGDQEALRVWLAEAKLARESALKPVQSDYQ